MRFALLGSGSAGNALVAEAGTTRLMLDCGFGPRETEKRLARLGLTPNDLTGIVITHEHDDHAGGAFKFAARHRLHIWVTHGTLRAAHRYIPEHFDSPITVIDSHTPFSVDGLEVYPYTVPHDSEEPVQYVFSDGMHKLGVLTDSGCSTPHIERMLSGCDALVLETNHDLDMLMNGPYAWPLKQRVKSRHGHLDNGSSASLLARLDNKRLKHLVAAHLSEKNNTPTLAAAALAGAMNCTTDWIAIATQHEGLDWRDIF
jgi:phosphoribosyl 1,2-cyclic phosphodiesterase